MYFKRLKAQFKHTVGMFDRQYKETKSVFKDYNNSIWFLGCSHVFGTGLEHYETAPYQLSSLSNKKVINLGHPGSGPMMVEQTLTKLLKKYEPLAIVIAWPNFDRWQSYEINFPGAVLWMPFCLEDSQSHNNHFGSKKLWPESYEKYKTMLLNNTIKDVNLKSYYNVKQITKNKKTIEFQYMPDEHISLNLPCYPFIDYARDDQHPGKLTQKIIAEYIWNKLNEI
jgi:hypothetical protein